MKKTGPPPLTNREIEALKLIYEGYTRPQLNAKMGLTTGRVSAILSSACWKLGYSPDQRIRAANLAREYRCF